MRLPDLDTLMECALEALTDGPQSGMEILRSVEDQQACSLRGREGSLYVALVRLEKEGFVVGGWEERPGGRRRCYSLPVLTDIGAPRAAKVAHE
jgi:DNA-binding PadR family transcriptional regulator